MKNLRTALLCVCITLSSLCAVAQSGAQKPSIPLNEPNPNKPLLFAGVPARVAVEESTLTNLLANSNGSNVNVTLGSHFNYQGQVVSASSAADARSNSVVIRSSNFAGSTLTVTAVTEADGTKSFVGRIVSLKHGDLLELERVNGQYVFVKKKFYDLVNE